MTIYKLIKVVETGHYILKYKEMIFIFDLIFNLHSDLGTALYTEGTGNLKNVKAATNPVKAVFRKNTLNSDNKQGENILFSKHSTTKYTEAIEDGAHFIFGIVNDPDSDTEYTEYTEYPANDENSIYEWIASLNSATNFDTSDFWVYGEIEAEFETDGTSGTSTKENHIIPLFKLTGAILVDAVIRRNVYKEGGRSFSELTFVVDILTATTTTNNLKYLTTSDSR